MKAHLITEHKEITIFSRDNFKALSRRNAEWKDTTGNCKSHHVTILQNKLQNEIKDGKSTSFKKPKGNNAKLLKVMQTAFRVLFMLD